MEPTTVVENIKKSKLDKIAYYSLLISVFLVPLAFLTTPYLAIDVAKTFVIVISTIISMVCYGLIVLKEKKIHAPPKYIFWTSVLMAVSLIVSSLTSIHIEKSLFGPGFEIGTASFLLALFLAGWSSYEAVRRHSERVLSVYTAAIVSFLIIFLIHLIRLFYPSFLASSSVFASLTSTLLGKWYDLAIYAVTISLISVSALLTLPLSKKIGLFTKIIAVVSILTAIYVNHYYTWLAAVIASAIFLATMFVNSHKGGRGFSGVLARISWLPAILLIVSIVFTWSGGKIVGKFIEKTGTQYSELSLPWQMTIDVAAGGFKNYPVFGIGPNHFSQAFMTYKPAGFNLTNAWTAEFNNGFGLVPTYITSQGLVGLILWILFFVFIGIVYGRSLRKLPEDHNARFTILSSTLASTFLWIVAILYVPSHALFFLTFVMTGIALASCVKNGHARDYVISPESGSAAKILFPSLTTGAVIVSIIWALVAVKQTTALAYFSKGVKSISSGQNFDAADKAFRTALSLDKSDVYWQAISENARLKASYLISTATSSSPTLLTTITNTIDTGTSAANKAIEFDKTNYYNYVSLARIAQVAASLKLEKGYDNAVKAYTDAISRNPLNPALYVALAQLQASNNNLDQALQTLGAALQVKNNYLDAVFLVSQIHAAKGNLPDAITAAQVAIQLNPGNALLHFQHGLLQYNAKNYSAAEEALAKAVEIQKDYANAKYFLGLSEVRLGNNEKALTLFQDLAQSNPDNTEVAFILNNLRAGRSPFTNAQPPISTPEKRPALPVKEKTN